MRRFITCILLCVSTVLPAWGVTDSLGINQSLGLSGSTALAPSTDAKAPAASSPQVSPPVAELQPQPPRRADTAANLASDVFGANLFTGTFAQQGATQFNPDYLIAVGDRLQVRLWGGFSYDAALVVDPQGNIFLPHVGPVRVLGVANSQLQSVVETAIRQVFRANVSSYVSLAAAQPVRVFVGGNVNRPGMYTGTSMDSLLHFLDQAGGIDPERGSFLDVQIKRGERLRASVNLYDFLLEGRIPLIQLADGDVVFVAPRQNTAVVRGLVDNARRFEFTAGQISIDALERLAKPAARATHVRIVRNTGTIRNTEYYALDDARQVQVSNGDEVEFTADKKPGTITVRVEGEHESPQEYVLPYGARFGDLIGRIELSQRSDPDSIQLYRRSVRERQMAMLNTALKSLESSVLTARSGTSDEARLRKEEADLILKWVDRAKAIQPSGQVLVAQTAQRNELLLENGDILRIPTRDGLVLVNGEVLFPNAVAFDPALALDEYIQRAGGYAQNADTSRVVIAHRDGSFEEAGQSGGFFGKGSGGAAVRPGDEILVLPRIDVKSRQITKDLTQILYQIAISAKVVLGL